VVERAVADRVHRIEGEIALRHREQAVEQRAGRFAVQWLRCDHALTVWPCQCVTLLCIALDADMHTVPVEPVLRQAFLPHRCRSAGGERDTQQHAQHGQDNGGG
jgi:hypothetical protein